MDGVVEDSILASTMREALKQEQLIDSALTSIFSQEGRQAVMKEIPKSTQRIAELSEYDIYGFERKLLNAHRSVSLSDISLAKLFKAMQSRGIIRQNKDKKP